MLVHSNYDKFPVVPVRGAAADAHAGWSAVLGRLRQAVAGRRVLVVECYPGVLERDLLERLQASLQPARALCTADLLKPSAEVQQMVARDLTDDPVFGRMNGITLADFFDPQRLAHTQAAVQAHRDGLLLVFGTGAALVARDADVLVYADMARWEIQARQRSGELASLGMPLGAETAAQLYKRGFFFDWRAADRLKKELLPRFDFLLDTNDRAVPKLITGNMLRDGLRQASRRPFRVVPFFDPGPWGGQWMKDVCDLPRETPNYAWCFDCVPEENSLRLAFGTVTVEVPAIDLVFAHPRELLGEAVHGRFGTEFPIRFDFLDTMEGGNLSFQVHPLTEYIQDRFGMAYTQDESYYLLDAAPDASVYLGLKENIDRRQMIADLHTAQEGGAPFQTEKYVNRWPARKHDHFLIPAGTPHCSGANSMVLEISATPYIFTFKMWDWGRLGLNGLPRPIHLEHGIANIQWERTTTWVREQLIGRIEAVCSGDGWREERTGLHEREFIETRRHWFTKAAPHHTQGGVNVLNLVEGEEAIVESPEGSFEPFAVHYAETFIVPAAVGPYTIRPAHPAENEYGTIKAYVRTRA